MLEYLQYVGDITIIGVLSLWVVACWIGTILGLPGNWAVAITAACVTALWRGEEAFVAAWVLVLLFLLAAIGELIEFATGAAGVGKLGGSKRAATLAIVGSLVGAIAGLFIGLPIPVIGSVVASLLLGGLGACGGAALGERWAGKEWDNSFQVGVAAFWGRLLGTLGKVACGFVMLCICLAAFWL